MRLRRRRAPVLAEIGSAAEGPRAGALRRADLDALRGLLKRLADRRVLLLTGEDGVKSEIAIGLAAVAGASGRATALLECDLARPRLAEMLGLRSRPGLHEYLRWEASAPEILQPLVLAGPASAGAADPVVCVVAGAPTSNASTLLASESFRHTTAKLRSAYELVVVDGPPLAHDGGSLAIAAAEADSTLACISAGASLPKKLPVPVAGLVQRS
jgi:succinoglycan biosynthesis transport protein ExoP